MCYDISMRIVKERPLKDFWSTHADAERPLAIWIRDCRRAAWRSAADVKAYARSADYVGNMRWVFNIGGNKYRLVVAISFRTGVVLVKFIGTHAEYDGINVETVESGGEG